jgi:hypothetical protein
VVPPDSHRIPRVPCYLGMRSQDVRLTPTGLSPSTAPLSKGFNFTHTISQPVDSPTTKHTPQPPHSNPCQVSHYAGLASSAFARHYSRNHGCFLFHPVLRCFTSRSSLHTPYFIQARVTGHDSSQVSPFGHPRINARLPTPQGLSQAPTSFIGS